MNVPGRNRTATTHRIWIRKALLSESHGTVLWHCVSNSQIASDFERHCLLFRTMSIDLSVFVPCLRATSIRNLQHHCRMHTEDSRFICPPSAGNDSAFALLLSDRMSSISSCSGLSMRRNLAVLTQPPGNRWVSQILHTFIIVNFRFMSITNTLLSDHTNNHLNPNPTSTAHPQDNAPD